MKSVEIFEAEILFICLSASNARLYDIQMLMQHDDFLSVSPGSDTLVAQSKLYPTHAQKTPPMQMQCKPSSELSGGKKVILYRMLLKST